MEEINNQKKKKITMDYLARIVQEGFLSMKERFTGVEGRLTSVEEKLETIEASVAVLKTDVKDIKANLNKKVDTIEYNTLEYRVEKLEKKSV